MTRALTLLLLLAAIGCGASALSVMSDSIDAARLGLKATCTAETIPCEVKRMRLNEAIAAYDAALAAQGTPSAEPAEQAALEAMAAYNAAQSSQPPPAPPDEVDRPP